MDIQENINNTKNIEEFSIKVPWGLIAVKAWGNKTDPHILVFHGRFDNAGSFDNLIPLLSNCFYYICVDLPSHGKSSPFPPHVPLHSTDFLIPCMLLVKHFKMEKYIFLAHSFGGQIANLFTMLYPNYVEKLITLDIYTFIGVSTKHVTKQLRERMDKTIDIAEKLVSGKPPSLTYEEAVQRISYNRYNGSSLVRKAADPILKRSLVLKDDGTYHFSTDQRMKTYLDPLSDVKYLSQAIKSSPVSVPTLTIFAKLNEIPQKQFAKMVSFVGKPKNVTVIYVDGHHDVHNNNPERVAGYINEFLLKQTAKI